MKDEPFLEKGVNKELSLSRKLRSENRSNEPFEIMLSSLTLEEVIVLKLECSSRLTNGKLYGFKLWSNHLDILKEAIYTAVVSITKNNKQAMRVLGINQIVFSKLKRKYDIKNNLKSELDLNR